MIKGPNLGGGGKKQEKIEEQQHSWRGSPFSTPKTIFYLYTAGGGDLFPITPVTIFLACRVKFTNHFA